MLFQNHVFRCDLKLYEVMGQYSYTCISEAFAFCLCVCVSAYQKSKCINQQEHDGVIQQSGVKVAFRFKINSLTFKLTFAKVK